MRRAPTSSASRRELRGVPDRLASFAWSTQVDRGKGTGWARPSLSLCDPGIRYAAVSRRRRNRPLRGSSLEGCSLTLRRLHYAVSRRQSQPCTSLSRIVAFRLSVSSSWLKAAQRPDPAAASGASAVGRLVDWSVGFIISACSDRACLRHFPARLLD